MKTKTLSPCKCVYHPDPGRTVDCEHCTTYHFIVLDGQPTDMIECCECVVELQFFGHDYLKKHFDYDYAHPCEVCWLPLHIHNWVWLGLYGFVEECSIGVGHSD